MTGVALIGCGWVQHFHARGVLAHPDGQLVALANHRMETASVFAEEHSMIRNTVKRFEKRNPQPILKNQPNDPKRGAAQRERIARTSWALVDREKCDGHTL